MLLSKFKAVFFDVGGTMISVHPSVGDVYAKHARDFGFSGTSYELNEGFRSQWKKMGGIESLGNKSGPEAEEKFWKDLVFEVFQPLGGLNRFDEYFELIFEVFRDGSNWKIHEDVIESRIFEKLKARGIILGVISNWDSRLTSTLENLKLAEHFKFILPSAVVGSAKPDNKIFEEALRLSGVKPQEACHIGDEVKTDIVGARNAGIHGILLDRDNRFDDSIQPKVKSFLELA
jgi:putative hydrolase of the HAD superfamily